MYNKIINPKTNRPVNINSKQGINIVTAYYNILRGAGENDRTGRIGQFGDDGERHKTWQIAGPPPPPEEEQQGGRHARHLKGAGENDRTGRTVQWAGPDGIRRPAWQIAGPPPHEEEQEGGGHMGRNLTHRRRGQNARNARSNRPKWWRIRTDNNRNVWIQFRLGATGEEIVRALHYRFPNAWDCALGGDLYHNNTLYYDRDCDPIGDDRLMNWVTDDNDPEDFVLIYMAPQDDSDDSDEDEDDSDNDNY